MADDEHEQLSRQTGMVLRTAIQVAMQVADALARRREQNLRSAAAASEARARAVTARLTAEQRSAEAFLRNMSDRQWWATAEDARIVDAVRIAHTWKDTSPVADRAAVTIEESLRTDKGIDLTSLRDTMNTAAVAATVERELADRAENEHSVDQSAQLDAAAPAAHSNHAVPMPRMHLDWDAPERRERDVAALMAAGVDPEAIDAHMLTDTSNATPLGATSMHAPTAAPSVTAGDRGQNVDRSVDRGEDRPTTSRAVLVWPLVRTRGARLPLRREKRGVRPEFRVNRACPASWFDSHPTRSVLMAMTRWALWAERSSATVQ